MIEWSLIYRSCRTTIALARLMMQSGFGVIMTIGDVQSSSSSCEISFRRGDDAASPRSGKLDLISQLNLDRSRGTRHRIYLPYCHPSAATHHYRFESRMETELRLIA